MKHLIVFSSLIIFTNVLSMESKSHLLSPEARTILDYAKSRVTEHCNQKLLEIAHQSDREQIIREIKNYYHFQQPRNQTNFWAYVLKPSINAQKVCAYIQLLRSSSYQVRKKADQTLPIEKLEFEPVDSNMLARTNELWPLVSVQYELKEMENHLTRIYHWTHEEITHWKQQNHEMAVCELNALEQDSKAVRNAIAVCKQSVETE